MRFSVAMPEDLLVEFDALVARRGLAKNRSEVIRDLVRNELAEQALDRPGEEVMGTLTIVFNHHTNDVREKLDNIQHEYLGMVITSLHVHMDEDMCMEVIILRGETDVVQAVANLIIGTKGVLHGKLALTSTGHNLIDEGLVRAGMQGAQAHAHDHAHPHTHPHPHTHDHSRGR